MVQLQGFTPELRRNLIRYGQRFPFKVASCGRCLPRGNRGDLHRREYQAEERPQDRRHTHALLIARQLQTDYSKVFQALETLKEPGIRLRQLQIDSTTGRVRVEYEFESLEKISMISGHLNSGYTSPPWQFEGSSENPGSPRGSLPVIGNQLRTS